MKKGVKGEGRKEVGGRQKKGGVKKKGRGISQKRRRGKKGTSVEKG